MKFIDVHARMVDVDTTHLLSIYTGAIREVCRNVHFEDRVTYWTGRSNIKYCEASKDSRFVPVADKPTSGRKSCLR